MFSANRDGFISSFPTCMPFTYFSCLNALWHPDKVEQEWGEWTSLFLVLGRKHSVLTSRYDIACFFFMPFIGLRKFSVPSLWEFCGCYETISWTSMNGCWISLNAFLHCLIHSWEFHLWFVNIVAYIDLSSKLCISETRLPYFSILLDSIC